MKITILMDNVSNNDLQPEWGLAIHIEYNGRKFLLDTGASGKFAENADVLGIDLADVDYGILSHAHFDHSDGMAAFFERNSRANFYLRKSAAENCFENSSGNSKYIGIHRGFLDTYRQRLIYVDGDYELASDVYLIPHKTPNLEEQGIKSHMFLRIGDSWYPDRFAHEQSLVFDTENGLVIFSSCSHSGADNIIQEIAAAFPDKPIQALIGGLHLFRTSAEDVRGLADRVRNTGIGKVITGHCTGDKALCILKEELGDIVESFYVGQKIQL